MNPEQIIALLSTIIGAPILIEISKRWFEGRNLRLQTDAQEEKDRDDREWKALQDAISRERDVYARFIADQKVDFEQRLSAVEVKLGKIQEEAASYQRLYWEERVRREGLQVRVDSLEYQLKVMERIASNGRELAGSTDKP